MTDQAFRQAIIFGLRAFLQELEALGSPEGDEGAEGVQRVVWRIALENGNDLIESAYFCGQRFASRSEAQLVLERTTAHLDTMAPYQVELVTEDA